jgi:hypothetical protein
MCDYQFRIRSVARKVGMGKRKTVLRVSRNKRAKLPDIIPPRSVFRLVRSDAKTPGWKADVDRVFRIGHYSRKDGLDVIWLVNEQGKYEQTTDRDFLLKYFEPIEISGESDLYGDGKPPFEPI